MVRPVQGNSPEQKAMERSYSGPKCGGIRAALPVSPIWNLEQNVDYSHTLMSLGKPGLGKFDQKA